jgi:hypothetical protein
MTSITLPLVVFEEQRAIYRVAIWVSMVKHLLDKEWSRERLEGLLRQELRAGALTITIKAAQAADAGDEIADAALRTVYAEMVGGALTELGPGHLQLRAYGQRAVLRAPHTRPRGHRWYDDWTRNLGICVLVDLACREFGLQPTRNREARRANRNPSGISLVVAGFARNKIHLDEGSVQQNIWFGLCGELARHAIAEQPPEIWMAARHLLDGSVS